MAVDKELVREVILFAENNVRCYESLMANYLPNLQKKVLKGVYDRKLAIKLLVYYYSNYVRPEMIKPRVYGLDPKLNPEERLIFAEKIQSPLHLSRLKIIDICLDTLPYNGHTTTSDALRAGIPVVTCMGKTFAGRVASSLLRATNMDELITNNLDEYENLAVNLALDPKRLSQIKKRIIDNKDLILFNSKLFTENLEKAYKTVHQIYNSDLEKKDIFIN